MSFIGDVTSECMGALRSALDGQHYVTAHTSDGEPFAFEFWWPAYGAEGAQLLKVVVSDATDVGVENMERSR